MTFTSLMTSPGFAPTFLDTMHQAVNQAARPADVCSDSPELGRPAHTYAPPRLIDPQANEAADLRFMASDALAPATREWEAAHARLLAFCQKHKLDGASAELAHLTLDAQRLAKHKNSVPDHLRREFKAPLEALAQHVWNERIPLTARCEVMTRLAELDLCLDRKLSELRKAALELGAYLGGLPGEAGKAFVALCNAHVQELLREEPRLKDQDVTTPHVLLPFTKALRLPGYHHADTVDDDYSLDIRGYRDIVDRCKLALVQRIDGMTLAEWLADLCLREAAQALTHQLGGMTPDFFNGDGHWEAMAQVTRTLSGRFGPLDPHSFCQLDADLFPERLTDDASMLAIEIHRNLVERGVIAAPKDQPLDHYVSDGRSHQVGLREGRPYVRIDGMPGAPPLLRPLTTIEANELLRRDAKTGAVNGASPPRLDDDARECLRDFVVMTGAPSLARRLALACPSPARIGHIIEHVILDDATVAGWMNREPEKWGAEALDNALHQILRCSHREALRALLRHWQAPGFPEAWARQVRRQATLGRAANQDRRIKGVHEDGRPQDNLRNAQSELLSRMENLLGEPVPLGPCRRAARTFAGAHPPGPVRRVDEASLRQLVSALEGLRDGPGQPLIAPLLSEDGGLAGALESTLFTSGPDKLVSELALARRLVETLQLSPDAARALLQVTSNDRFPVPFPLLGATLLLGRAPSLIAEVFRWTRSMFRDGLLDTAAVRRILLPDTLAAEHAFTPATGAPVANALRHYLDELRAAADDGLLSREDLENAAGLDGKAPAALLRTAVTRGGPTADRHWEAWQKALEAARPQ
jgi:hypothetical protein